MAPRALASLAVLAEQEGDLETALDHLTELRRLEPRILYHILEFARVARRMAAWEQAEDALNWGRVTHPDSSRPLEELCTLYIESDDLAAARRTLLELERRDGDSLENRRFRQRIEERSDSGS